MKVLVIGKSGQLARALAERQAEFSELSLKFVGRPEIDLEILNTIRPAIVAAEPQFVINAAAFTAVDLAEENRDICHQINAVAAGEIARTAREVGAGVVQISTDYVFDGKKSAPYQENDATSPVNWYGETKWQGEEAVRAANPRHVILRASWIYSPFGSNFLKTMLKLANTRSQVSVVGDQVGNPTSALDLASGILLALNKFQQGKEFGIGETYHLAGNGQCSWAEFAERIFSIHRAAGGSDIVVNSINTNQWPTAAGRPGNSTLDCGKFAACFDYSLPDWKQSTDEIVNALMVTDKCVGPL